MDVISHGLWGSLAFGRKSRQSFWLAFSFGVAPDVIAFGPLFVARIFGFDGGFNFESGPPPASQIPQYIYSLYSFTHSLIIFAMIFALVWLFMRRPVWELCAWGLHILVDILTHSYQFFPTPFLWPISNFKINSLNWSDPVIFIPDVALLIIAYSWLYIVRRKFRKQPNLTA